MKPKTQAQKLAQELAAYANPKGDLPFEIFLAISKMVVFTACEIVVVNEKKEILLCWRNDRWWTGWHFPGGLLRFGEKFEQRLKKTAVAELGVKLLSSKFLFPVNYPVSKRGQDVGLIFLCKVSGQPKSGKFFKSPPKDLIFEHKKVWKNLQQYLKINING